MPQRNLRKASTINDHLAMRVFFGASCLELAEALNTRY